jgi:GalNAc-alpha-(1->4)-GalNAc-alpha-(1->3)-diNAcBac-PP-undecaprenol alpha-1,4-N-acetyl-D-galactosaminyltransferase
MRILCVISSLQNGGAERVMTWLSRGLAQRGHQVTLASFEDGRQAPFYGAPDGVELRYLDLLRASRTPAAALTANSRRVLRIRHLYRDLDPHAVVSFVDRTNVLALAAGVGTARPIVVSERVDPRTVRIGRAWWWARKSLYRRCRALVLQAEDVRPFFESALQERVHVIANPVVLPGDGPTERPAPPRKRLLAVGRLDPQKGFDLLIEAFVQLAHLFPAWELLILGEGPARRDLEARIAGHRLADRIHLPGRRPDPFPFYRGADLFVLSSRFEGFPGVLVEAMAMGLPVAGTACTGSVTEILEGGRSGLLLAPNSAKALEEGLGKLMGDAELRERLALAARGVVERYCPDRILDQWETLLRDVVA